MSSTATITVAETADGDTRPVRLLVLLATTVTSKPLLALTSGDSEVTASAADDVIVLSSHRGLQQHDFSTL